MPKRILGGSQSANQLLLKYIVQHMTRRNSWVIDFSPLLSKATLSFILFMNLSDLILGGLSPLLLEGGARTSFLLCLETV